MNYGVFALGPTLTWPVKEPDAYLDYSYDASDDVGSAAIGTSSVSTDAIGTFSVSIAPSGAGELVADNLSISGSVITLWLAGGVAGRDYVVKIDGTCQSGRVFSWCIGLAMDPLLARYPLAVPPSAGFGAPVSWP
jgi:hypothetical protein